jgi:hypothetical protein
LTETAANPLALEFSRQYREPESSDDVPAVDYEAAPEFEPTRAEYNPASAIAPLVEQIQFLSQENQILRSLAATAIEQGGEAMALADALEASRAPRRPRWWKWWAR